MHFNSLQLKYCNLSVGYTKIYQNVLNLKYNTDRDFVRLRLYLQLVLIISAVSSPTNTLRPRQNGRHFPDDILKWIFLNENMWTSIKISLKFVPRGSVNNIPALVRIMAWRRPGDKPLSVPMLVRSLTHICVNRPQWVNIIHWSDDEPRKIESYK